MKLLFVCLAALPVFVFWTLLVLLTFPLKNRFPLINALIQEYIDTISLVIHYPFSNKYHYTAGSGKPIILIHGYLHNASGWRKLINRLKQENYGPIYALDLGDGTIGGKFWSINKYAKQVQQKIEETGLKDFTIIGHSMGGLVASACAKITPPGAVTNIYTIGTPLFGSPLAHCFGIGPNGREMIPGSKLLQDVSQAILETSDRIHYRHIGSKVDQLVPPHPNLDFVVEDEGHVSLMTSHRVADKLCEWLHHVL